MTAVDPAPRADRVPPQRPAVPGRDLPVEVRAAVLHSVDLAGGSRLALPEIALRHDLTLDQVKEIVAVAHTVAAETAAAERRQERVHALLAEGHRHRSARIRRAAGKAAGALDKLVVLLREDRARQAAAELERAAREAARAAERAARQAEKAAQKPTPGRRGGATPLPEPAPCGLPGCDRSFDTAQGLSLHRRRAHGPKEETR